MKETKKKINLDQPVTYQIKVPGELSDQWTDWYKGITVMHGAEEGQPVTTLTISSDQASLQSLLRRLYSLGLPLLSVKNLEKSDLNTGENTMKKDSKRPIMLWPLVILLILLSMGGLSSGISMLVDPASGGYLQFADLLALLPVSNFILPGLFLLSVMEFFPLLLVYSLIKRPAWSRIDKLFGWSKHYWAWAGILLLVAIMGFWLVYEGWLIGWFPITKFTAILGLLIFLFAMLPGVRGFYSQ